MGALRDRITDEMILRGFSESTIKAYTATLSDLSRFLSKPLLRVTDSDIKSYFLHLFKERHLSIAAVIVAASALKFFLRVTGRAHLEKSIPRIKRPEQVALVMNKAEIQAFFDIPSPLRECSLKTESLKHHDQMQLGFSLDGLQWR